MLFRNYSRPIGFFHNSNLGQRLATQLLLKSPEMNEIRSKSTPEHSAEREDSAVPEMPLPSDLRVVFLAGLFLLAVLAALYVARAIVLPVVLALILKLLLQPLIRLAD